jgi:hypothetical protein
LNASLNDCSYLRRGKRGYEKRIGDERMRKREKRTVFLGGGIGGGAAEEAEAITFMEQSRTREGIREERSGSVTT